MFTLTIEMERVALATHVLDISTHSSTFLMAQTELHLYIIIYVWTNYFALLKHSNGEMSAGCWQKELEPYVNQHLCAHTDGDMSSSLPFHIYHEWEQRCKDIIRVAVSYSVVSILVCTQAPHWNHWSTPALFTLTHRVSSYAINGARVVCQYAIKYISRNGKMGRKQNASHIRTNTFDAKKNNAFNTHKRWNTLDKCRTRANNMMGKLKWWNVKISGNASAISLTASANQSNGIPHACIPCTAIHSAIRSKYKNDSNILYTLLYQAMPRG